MLTSSRPPKAPPTPPRCSRTCSGGRPEAGGDLVAVLVQPLGGDPQVDPALAVGHGQPRLGAEERLVLHADLVGALDHHVAGRRRRRRGSTTMRRITLPSGWIGGGAGGGVGVDQRGQRLVGDLDGVQRPAGGVGVVGRHRRHRLAHEAHDVAGEHRLVGRDEPVGGGAGHVVGGDHAGHAGDGQRRARRRRTRCGRGGGATAACGPTASRRRTGRTRRRSRPCTLGVPSGRTGLSPTRPPADPPRTVAGPGGRSRVARAGGQGAGDGRRRDARPPPARPRRGCGRSRCSGTGCRPAPRGTSSGPGSGTRSSRSWMATTNPGVQNPHCTPPASTIACCTSVSTSPARAASPGSPPAGARPSTVVTAQPTAASASSRQAHTSTPSTSTEHEPHSPCSQAFLAPGRPSRSRRTCSRLSPAWAPSTGRATPLTTSS